MLHDTKHGRSYRFPWAIVKVWSLANGHRTVAEIAEHAGLTERTFFRYFTDKREALFFGEDEFQALLVEQVSTAPLPPMAAIKAALHVLGAKWESIPGRPRVQAEGKPRQGPSVGPTFTPSTARAVSKRIRRSFGKDLVLT